MPKQQKTLLLVLMVLVMITLNADGNVMAPMLSRIEADFGVNDDAIGNMMALFTLVGAIISLLWGYFVDKASRKMLFVLAVAIGEIPCLLTYWAPNFTIFYILRILTGIGVGAAFPLVFSILGDIYDEKERPFTTAVLTTSFGLGNIVGTLVGGYLGPSLGWRLPFILVSAPNIIFVLLFLLFVPEPQKAASEEATKELVAQGVLYPKTIKLGDYASLVKVPTNVWLFIQGIAGTIPWGAFFFLNKFLETEKHFSVEVATTIFLVFGIGMVIGTIAGGKLGQLVFIKNNRMLPVFCGITTLIGMIVTLGVVLVNLSIPLMLISGFLAAFFAAMTGPNMRAMLMDVNPPEKRGAIFSIFNLTDSLGTGIGRWVAGLISVATTLTVSLAVSVSFWTICGIILVAIGGLFIRDMKHMHDQLALVAEEMKRSVSRAN